MGVTMKRLGFGALALAAVLLPMRKPTTAETPLPAANRGARLDTLSMSRHVAHMAWTAFELRDSAMATLKTLPPPGSRPFVSWRGFSGAVTNTQADSIVASLWPVIGAGDAHVRTSVLIYNRGHYAAPAYNGALITRHDSVTDCVAISPGRLGPKGEPWVWKDELDDALAPCAVLAAFGPPGASVGSWLEATRYSSVYSNQWLVHRRDTMTAAPWIAWSNWRRSDTYPDGPLFSAMDKVGVLNLALLMRPEYDFGATGLRCIVGMERDCVEGVLHSSLTYPSANVMPADLTQVGWRTYLEAKNVGTVRPPSRALVSAMITDFGREKFQKFWSSDQPFEAAFQSAFGETLGAWTARWAAHDWRNSDEARHGNPEILLGVTLRPSWLLITIGWSILALAIAAGVARRRTA